MPPGPRLTPAVHCRSRSGRRLGCRHCDRRRCSARSGAPSRRASVDRFRVIHFSIQQDHGHFIVEGDEARRARGGVHGLAIRLALAVNRALGRRGKVVGDRYHARPLTTPRHMRASMVYVLLNFRKHLRAPACVDPRSSGPHVSGWLYGRPVAATDAAAATALPTTWMARVGWRRAGGPLRWKNSQLPRRDSAQLEFAHVAPTGCAPPVVAMGPGWTAGTRRM
jgi:hypothetical protein